MQYGQPLGPGVPTHEENCDGVVFCAHEKRTAVPPAHEIGPANASTAQVAAAVQYEPGSQSMSRAQLGVSQWPVDGLQLCPVGQPVELQPGTHAPPEQMLAGAPTHSESLLQLGPPSGGRGQLGCDGSQQRPVDELHTSPDAHGSSVQPDTQVCVVMLQMTAGGSHIESSLQGVPPEHSPVDGSQVDAPVHRSVSIAQPETQ